MELGTASATDRSMPAACLIHITVKELPIVDLLLYNLPTTPGIVFAF